MYRISLRQSSDDREVVGFTTDLPSHEAVCAMEKIWMGSANECYIDVCRLVDSPLSDTANFRDLVDYELED